MRVLVTGVAGFVGSSIARRVLAAGHEVVGVDCFLDYYPRQLKELNLHSIRETGGDRFSFVEMNIARGDVAPLLRDVEVVYHQAAQAGVRKSWGDYFSTYVESNVIGTQALLDVIRIQKLPIKKFVYASSSSVYGSAERLPTSEQDLPAPVSPYGVTKLAAEHLCVLYAKEFGVPTASLRYFTVYGPGQRPDMAFYKFILAALEGRSIELYGTGEQTRDFTFIDDIVEANLLAAERAPAGAVYNIGGGATISVNQTLSILESIIGKIDVRRLARAAGDAAHTSADVSRALKELGFAPKVSVREGLAQEVEWLRDRLARGAVARL